MTNEETNWTVVTGSTGGIGREVVNILAKDGRDLILINRSSSSGSAQRDGVVARYPNVRVEVVTADFMDIASISDAITTIQALPGRVEALYNVAGVLNAAKITSVQGFESNFAVNTLAPYQLILGLREKMARPSNDRAAMIVNFTSSAVHRQKWLDLGSLSNPKVVTGLMGTYAQSKLALTAFSAALARDLQSDNILIRAVDPGATKSPMTTENSSMPRILQWLAPLLFANPDQQAIKVVKSADPGAFKARSGIFVANLKEKRLPKPAANGETWRRLLALMDHSLRSA